MSSLLERLLVTLSVTATPLFAAATAKKQKPKRAPGRRMPRKTAGRAAGRVKRRDVKRPAKRASRRPGAARGRRPLRSKPSARAPKPPARTQKTAGRAGARPKTPEPRAAAVTAPAPKGPPKPKPVAPTGRALLLAPERGKFAERTPSFRWLSVGGATRYEVAWSERPDFSDSRTLVSVATEAALPPDQSLRIGSTYFWRVRGGNEAGWGPWSPAASFQVLEELPTL